MQVGGLAISVGGEALRDELSRAASSPGMSHEFVDALFTITGQNVACNRLHSNEQRCARWLLIRPTGSRPTSPTDEFLAEMLGVRRASVSEIAGAGQARSPATAGV